MSKRYIFRFSKTGGMRFISHLDVQRLFRRVFRRIDVPLAFSQGYNPHPKINIAQPLSLGFESESEYLEIETEISLDVERVLAEANAALPEGIAFTAGKEAPLSPKNLSSLVEYAEYLIFMPSWRSADLQDQIALFNLQNNIIVNKRDKRTKMMVEKDVKALIKVFEGHASPEEGSVFHTLVRTASNEALNPLQLVESFYRLAGEPFERELCRVLRNEMYGLCSGKMISLYDCCAESDAL